VTGIGANVASCRATQTRHEVRQGLRAARPDDDPGAAALPRDGEQRGHDRPSRTSASWRICGSTSHNVVHIAPVPVTLVR
jgi:hypothetical protein